MVKKTKVIKMSTGLYFMLKELAIMENRAIKFLLERAVTNYLKAKKMIRE